MNNRARKALLWIVMLGGAWMVAQLGGCHTVSGAGEDISSAGRGISHTSDDVRPYN